MIGDIDKECILKESFAASIETTRFYSILFEMFFFFFDSYLVQWTNKLNNREGFWLLKITLLQ